MGPLSGDPTPAIKTILWIILGVGVAVGYLFTQVIPYFYWLITHTKVVL